MTFYTSGHKSCTPFVRVVVSKHVILLGDIAIGIVFLLSFTDCSLLVNRNTVVACVLIWYPETVQTHWLIFIVSCGFPEIFYTESRCMCIETVSLLPFQWGALISFFSHFWFWLCCLFLFLFFYHNVLVRTFMNLEDPVVECMDIYNYFIFLKNRDFICYEIPLFVSGNISVVLKSIFLILI